MKIRKILASSILAAPIALLPTITSCSNSEEGIIETGTQRLFKVTSEAPNATIPFHWTGAKDKTITFVIQNLGTHNVVSSSKINIDDNGNFKIVVHFSTSYTEDVTDQFNILFTYELNGEQKRQRVAGYTLGYDYLSRNPGYEIKTPNIKAHKLSWYGTNHEYIVGTWYIQLEQALSGNDPIEFAKILDIETVSHSDSFEIVEPVATDLNKLAIFEPTRSWLVFTVGFYLKEGYEFEAGQSYSLKLTWNTYAYKEGFEPTYPDPTTTEVLTMNLTNDILPEIEPVSEESHLKCIITQEELYYDKEKTKFSGLKIDSSFKGRIQFYFSSDEARELGYKFKRVGDPETDEFILQVVDTEPLDTTDTNDIKFKTRVVKGVTLTRLSTGDVLKFIDNEFPIVIRYTPDSDEYIPYEVEYNSGITEIYVDVTVEQ